MLLENESMEFDWFGDQNCDFKLGQKRANELYISTSFPREFSWPKTTASPVSLVNCPMGSGNLCFTISSVNMPASKLSYNTIVNSHLIHTYIRF